MLRLLCAALFSTPAWASGYYYADSGIVASGRGGAWIAGANTQFAQYHNPAGLIRIEAPTINLGVTGVKQSVTFDRLAGDGTWLPTVKNQGGIFPVPQLGFATPLGKRFAFAFGFTSPFSPKSSYEPDGAQRYSIVDTTIWKFSVGPSLAFQPVPYLTFGLGVRWQVLRLDEQVVLTTSGFTADGQDNPDGDVMANARVMDWFTPNMNLGLLIDPHPMVSIGAYFQPPVKFRAQGEGSLDFSEHALFKSGLLDQAVWEDDDIAVRIQLPMELKFGVAVRPVQGLEIELAGSWEQWSNLADIVIEDIDITLTGPIGEQPVDGSIALPAGFINTWSVRLGGEYRILDELDWRMGAFYETGAVPVKELSVALVDTKKVNIATGASVHTLKRRLRFDATFAYQVLWDHQIRDSEVTQIKAYGDQAGVVGNGNLRSDGLFFGAQVQWVFRKREQAIQSPPEPDTAAPPG